MILLAVLVAISGLIGFAAARYLYRHAPKYDYHAGFVRRAEIIKSVAHQIDPAQMAVIGDSIVEQQKLPHLCGLESLNAGMSGARASDIAELALPAIGAARPSRAVLAVGTNDFRDGRPVNGDHWKRNIQVILDQLPARPIVVGIGDLPNSSSQQIAAANLFLAAEASRRRGRFVAPLPANLTIDGIHPSVTGMREWQRRVQAACQDK